MVTRDSSTKVYGLHSIKGELKTSDSAVIDTVHERRLR